MKYLNPQFSVGMTTSQKHPNWNWPFDEKPKPDLGTVAGFPVQVDETMPPDELRLVGRNVVRLVNVKHPDGCECGLCGEGFRDVLTGLPAGEPETPGTELGEG